MEQFAGLKKLGVNIDKTLMAIDKQKMQQQIVSNATKKKKYAKHF